MSDIRRAKLPSALYSDVVKLWAEDVRRNRYLPLNKWVEWRLRQALNLSVKPIEPNDKPSLRVTLPRELADQIGTERDIKEAIEKAIA